MTREVCQEERVGVYPGSFDPPTIAHLAIAVAARRTCGLDRIDLVVSRSALDKEDAANAPFDLRMAVIRASVSHAPWLQVLETDKQLIADIADGYDVVVLGTDKWAQVVDPRFYGDSESARDAAVARLPEVAAVERPGAGPPPDSSTQLDLPERLRSVSSSGARDGEPSWMTPAARRAAAEHGVWGLGG